MQKYLERLSKAYYDGSPLVSNEEYDALERIHGQIIGGYGEVQHLHRMYSLQKHYETDGEPPLPLNQCFKSNKLDGAAVSTTYQQGKLVLGLTRGDGIKGRPITEKLAGLVPTCIPIDAELVQITGEVIALESVENSRNFASGALNLKDLVEFAGRIETGKLKFVAYDIIGMEFETYADKLDFLSSCGFETIADDHPGYPTDGIVYRLNNEKAFNQAGYTAKFPKGAFAFKENQKPVETTLLDVVWQTGKSGKVTPVAILEPVLVGDATVSRATLNNMAYIEALNLEIGCRVGIVRAGEIIPKIIARIDE